MRWLSTTGSNARRRRRAPQRAVVCVLNNSAGADALSRRGLPKLLDARDPGHTMLSFDEFGMPCRAFVLLGANPEDRPFGPPEILDTLWTEADAIDARARFGGRIVFRRDADLEWAIDECNRTLTSKQVRLVRIGTSIQLIYISQRGDPFHADRWPLDRPGSTPLERVTRKDLEEWALSKLSAFLNEREGGADVGESNYELVVRSSGKVALGCRSRDRRYKWDKLVLTDDADRSFWLKAFQCYSSTYHPNECSRRVQQLRGMR
jgi:hypothetical protein